MIDWVVLLTPLLVLAVVALLGFAGCSFEARVSAPLAIRVRVPTALTVTQVVFRWTPPGGTLTQETYTNPTPHSTDGPDNLYQHGLYSPPVGTWMSSCRVTVQEGTATDEDGDQGDFLYEDSVTLRASYQASGSPSGGNFAVTFSGAFEE